MVERIRRTRARLWVRAGAAALVIAVVSGCAGSPPRQIEVFDGTFDTVAQIVGYGGGFASDAAKVRSRTEELHRLFDIYHNYEGLNNAKTINDCAGVRPVEVPRELFEVIALGVEWHERTGGKLNIALGPVLRLWKSGTERGIPPDGNALMAALALCDIRGVILDESAMTVFLAREGMSLDLGAIAKGYASRVALEEASGALLLNLGGNVAVSGLPPGRKAWSVGVRDPDDAQKSALTLSVESGAVVTSGDYERCFYDANGRRLGHIIDPETAWPVSLYRSVTLSGPDAAVCDILSTALFLMPVDEGRLLAEESGCRAIWILPDGTTLENF